MKKIIEKTFDFIGTITGVLVLLAIGFIMALIVGAIMGILFKGLEFGLTILNIK